MSIIEGAIHFATDAHSGQTRKAKQTPYILHPLEVGAIAASMTDDQEVIAAAILHDTVEDTGATLDDIEYAFGARIADLVAHESENKREDQPAADTWRIRKQETIDGLQTAPTEVLLITLADKLSNVRSMYVDKQQVGEKLWERFNQKDPAEQHWYYQAIADATSPLRNQRAWQEYQELVNKVFATGE